VKGKGELTSIAGRSPTSYAEIVDFLGGQKPSLDTIVTTHKKVATRHAK
jgi:hypothetical protein